MKKFFIVSTIIIGFFLCCTAHATYIVDTGQPTYQRCDFWIINQRHDSRVFAQFTLTEPYYITTIQGYVDFLQESQLYTGIYQVQQIPDPDELQPVLTQIYYGSVEFTKAYYGWAGPSGLSWYLEAGTYWISFYAERSSLADAYMGSRNSQVGYVPNRLVEMFSDQSSFPIESIPLDECWYETLNLGVRIEGVEASVPEPATMVLLGLGLLGLAGIKRRQI